MTTYNLVSSGTTTNRLAFLRVKLRSAPSLFLPKLLQPPTFFLSSLLSQCITCRCQEGIINSVLSSHVNSREMLPIDCRLMSRFLRITFRSPSTICFPHTDSSIKTPLVLSDKVGHTSCGLFSASVPSIMSLVSFDASVCWCLESLRKAS